MGRQCSQSRRLAALTILPQVCQQDCPSIRQSAVTRTRHIHSRSRHARCTSRAAHHARTSHCTSLSTPPHRHSLSTLIRTCPSRLGDRGELSQNSCDRASHERRQGGRRLFILLSPSCASQHTSPFPETQARGTSTRALASSTPERLPQALASSTHPQSPACTHFLTKGCRVKKHGHSRLVHRRLSARFGCRLQTIKEHSGSSKEHSGSRTDVVLGRLLWPPDCTQTAWLSTSLNHPVYRHTRDWGNATALNLTFDSPSVLAVGSRSNLVPRYERCVVEI